MPHLLQNNLARLLIALLVLGGSPCLEGVTAAGLEDGWTKRLAIPHPSLGEGDHYVAWVEQGWLQVRREKASGETDWHIVLAEASDATPPTIEAPKDSVSFALSYHDGRYFVREDAFLLRCVRQRKAGIAKWPSIPATAVRDGVFRASAGSKDRPPVLQQWRAGEWIVAASGVDKQQADCLLRLCPADPQVERNNGPWGAQAFRAPSSLTELFYKDHRLVDDGELLFANRLLAQQKPRPTRGDPAPPLNVETLDGKPLTLEEFRGKYVLLDFWATWCAPCIAEFPHLERIHREFGRDERFVMIGLSIDDDIEAPRAFLAKRKLPWLQAFAGNAAESKAAKDYGVEAIPATFLIDPDGKIIAIDLRGEKLHAAIAEALKQ